MDLIGSLMQSVSEAHYVTIVTACFAVVVGVFAHFPAFRTLPVYPRSH